MNRLFRAILAIVFIAVIMVSAVSICQSIGRQWRADLTEQNIYTLSDGTKAILDQVQQPLKMKLFYSKTAAMKAPDQIRFYNSYYFFVHELLQEYARYAQGKIELELVDPRPFTDAEEDALRYGLQLIPITQTENFVFGLVVESEFGVIKNIPFFSPDRQSFVEYDISALVDRTITRQKQRLAVLSSLPVMGGQMDQMMRMQGRRPDPAWTIIEQLRGKYDVSALDADVEEINPSDVDMLLVIHPKDLPEQTLFAIDQYVLQGGRTVVCVDPYCLSDQPEQQQMMMGQSGHSSASNLDPLLAAWGLEMPADTFVGDRELAEERSLQRNTRPVPIIGLLGMNRDAMNDESIITSDLNMVRVFFGGALQPVGDAEDGTVSYTPLLSTTAKGNTFTVDNPYMMQMPQRLIDSFTDGSEPVCMGYQITGKLKSAFPEGITVEVPDEDAPEPEGENAEPATKTEQRTGLTESEQDAAVVVFSDVDFISDMFAYSRSFLGMMTIGDNSALLMNAIDFMTNSTELISIRSRGNYTRPFEVVDRIEAQASKDSAAEIAQIQAEIEEIETQINAVVSQAKSTEEALMAAGQVMERQQLELKRRQAQRRLREVQRRKSEDIEALGQKLEYINVLAAPAIILVIAIILAMQRSVKRHRWVSHASDA